MDNFLELTLDLSKHYGVSVDIYVNDMMKVNEFVYETLKGFNLTLISIDNIILKIKRNNEVLTQSELLKDGNLRNGDVLELL